MRDDVFWIPITAIVGIPQRTLRYWCATARLRARKQKRKDSAKESKKVWHVYKPDLIEASR